MKNKNIAEQINQTIEDIWIIQKYYANLSPIELVNM